MRYTLQQIKDGTGFADGATFEQVEDYNGWTNRETWAVALHINNDQGWQESVHEALRDRIADSPDPDNDESLIFDAGVIINENVDETLELLLQDVFEHGRTEPDAFTGIRNDIGSLWRVNWTELGASFLSDLAESE